MIRSPQQLPGAEELCSAGFPCFDKNNINSNANIETWSGNMASGTKTMVPPGLSSVLQPCGDHKQKQRGHQTRRIAPGVLLAAENSVTANEGWIYGWDGTLRGLHHHYMQLCSGGEGQRSCVGLSLMQTAVLRRGITTFTPLIVAAAYRVHNSCSV